ncbi:MAG: efflux RND transporter periplasmic adaptor subunit [Ferrovibrio sp.]|uniref:efflux RND transporter periplasmic adaptor subunit n=1 Tax=Ferrovibrio sp. TaxID=1917215 RepID=UPI0026051B2E|nr:efflux RND transporter periplasmic adaptor subunit [Ferrovibrio sp.]MCW0233097.1 efflux RND transporter periplasmic adaptor subunit [Ferrovibrio sp.]
MSFGKFRNGALAIAVLTGIGSLAQALLAPAALAQGGPPPVTVAKPVVRAVVEMDEYTGRFDAIGAVEIRARVNGYLDTVHFQDGAMVNQGDLLFTIDRRTYQAAFNQAQATLNSRQTEFDLAKLEFERYQKLTQTGAAAAATLDQRRQTFLAAQANIAGARAAAETTRLQLSFTEVRAPIAGRISRKLVTEGNLVRENETLLTTVVQVDPVHFYFDIDERSYLSYQRIAKQGGQSSSGGSNGRGLQVSVMLTDEKTFVHQGVLDFTDNRLDSATGTMRLRAVFQNKDQFLTPGLFGRIAVPGSPEYQAVMLPDEAILTDLDRRYVYVVGDGGAVQQRPVRVGSRTDNYRIIREGLKGDETVVINGLQRVRLGGGKVTPQPVELPKVWAGLMALPQPQAAQQPAPAK